jgi:hypothetical protein
MLDRTYAGLVSRGFDILFKDRFILFFIYANYYKLRFA